MKNHYILKTEDDITYTETKAEAIEVFERFYKRKILPEDVKRFEMNRANGDWNCG